METVWFAAMLALVNAKVARRGRIGPVAAIGLGLATLTRPEGLRHAAVLIAADGVRAVTVAGGRRPPKKLLVPALVFPNPWAIVLPAQLPIRTGGPAGHDGRHPRRWRTLVRPRGIPVAFARALSRSRAADDSEVHPY